MSSSPLYPAIQNNEVKVDVYPETSYQNSSRLPIRENEISRLDNQLTMWENNLYRMDKKLSYVLVLLGAPTALTFFIGFQFI